MIMMIHHTFRTKRRSYLLPFSLLVLLLLVLKVMRKIYQDIGWVIGKYLEYSHKVFWFFDNVVEADFFMLVWRMHRCIGNILVRYIMWIYFSIKPEFYHIHISHKKNSYNWKECSFLEHVPPGFCLFVKNQSLSNIINHSKLYKLIHHQPFNAIQSKYFLLSLKLVWAHMRILTFDHFLFVWKWAICNITINEICLIDRDFKYFLIQIRSSIMKYNILPIFQLKSWLSI